MKYKLTKIITEEINIELPVYVKYAGKLFKILSEEDHVEVGLGNNLGIQMFAGLPYSTSNCITHGTPITETEFNQAYDKALRILLTNRPLKRLAKLEKVFDVDTIPTNSSYKNIPAL